jgi:hypothetical protein
MLRREAQFGASRAWNSATRARLRPLMGVSEDAALRSRFNPAFPRNKEWIEFSHWLAQRWFKGTFAEALANRPLNLKAMWGVEHALVDRFRLGMLKQPFQSALEAEAYSGLRAQWGLAPTWVQQTAIGGGKVGASFMLRPPDPQ